MEKIFVDSENDFPNTIAHMTLIGELHKKQRQLEELAPDTTANKNKVSSKRDRENTLEASVKFVQKSGPWAVLKPHMPVYLNIIQQISSYLEKENEEPKSAKCEDKSLEESLLLSYPSSQIKGTVKKIIQTKVEEDHYFSKYVQNISHKDLSSIKY
ncbi:unnamed protein product [Meganyctiphanes norvegica]|uniref:Uncharacterized protein n=1 Tax=Meganyctiphanes norvegica TaxID=48144 RepID=A0AAV2S0V6_MEGNR